MYIIFYYILQYIVFGQSSTKSCHLLLSQINPMGDLSIKNTKWCTIRLKCLPHFPPPFLTFARCRTERRTFWSCSTWLKLWLQTRRMYCMDSSLSLEILGNFSDVSRMKICKNHLSSYDIFFLWLVLGMICNMLNAYVLDLENNCLLSFHFFK